MSRIVSANNERRHMSLPERAAAPALTLAENGHREGWTVDLRDPRARRLPKVADPPNRGADGCRTPGWLKGDDPSRLPALRLNHTRVKCDTLNCVASR